MKLTKWLIAALTIIPMAAYAEESQKCDLYWHGCCYVHVAPNVQYADAMKGVEMRSTDNGTIEIYVDGKSAQPLWCGKSTKPK